MTFTRKAICSWVPRLALKAPVAASVAHGLRMAVNLVVVKLIAVLIGPSGMGALGNLMSVTTIVGVFAGGGIGNGITKYVAEFSAQKRRMIRFIGAAAVFGLVVSLLVLGVTVVAAEPLARWLFRDDGYAWLMPCLGIAHFLCFVGTGVIAVANGQHRPDLFAAISITAYLGSIPIAYLLIYFFRMEGAGLALLLVAACTGFPAMWIALRSRLLPLVRLRIDFEDATRLAKFSLMALVSATLFPSTEIFIRTEIIAQLSLANAGIWQAMTRLSGAYLGFFTVFLATSYMPRLSALSDKIQVVSAVYRMTMMVAIAFAAAAITIYTLKDAVIFLLFSSQFLEMRDFLAWQLVGDFFRVCAYTIAFLGVAKAAFRIHILAEFTQCCLYGLFALLALRNGGGLLEVARAYALTYAAYFVIALAALHLYRHR